MGSLGNVLNTSQLASSGFTPGNLTPEPALHHRPLQKRIRNLTSAFTGFVSLGQLLNFSMPQVFSPSELGLTVDPI